GALTAFGLAVVEALESRPAHIDLAAHLEGIGEALGPDCLRDVGDGADIGGDVLALIAVAARGALGEPALLVAKRDGQPVDLRLGGEGEAFHSFEAEEAAYALQEVAHAL